MNARAKYDAFIAGIDTSVAGKDDYGDLRWHVECSAEANATGNNTSDEWFETALATARMCVDDWRSFYPQLIVREPGSDKFGWSGHFGITREWRNER